VQHLRSGTVGTVHQFEVAYDGQKGKVEVFRRSVCGVVAAVLAVAFVGCGSNSTESEEAGRPADAVILADSPEDQAIAAGLQKYMVRNCFPPGAGPTVPEKYRDRSIPPGYERILRGGVALCDNVVSIGVEDALVTVQAGLGQDVDDFGVGKAFCDFVQGSDVADFTTGHMLVDGSGEAIKVCPPRRG
jgi:hypothetical protein